MCKLYQLIKIMWYYWNQNGYLIDLEVRFFCEFLIKTYNERKRVKLKIPGCQGCHNVSCWDTGGNFYFLSFWRQQWPLRWTHVTHGALTMSLVTNSVSRNTNMEWSKSKKFTMKQKLVHEEGSELTWEPTDFMYTDDTRRNLQSRISGYEFMLWFNKGIRSVNNSYTEDMFSSFSQLAQTYDLPKNHFLGAL